MKKNSLWFIVAFCAMIHGVTSFAMEQSQSWYDRATSGISSAVDIAKYWYDGSLPSLSLPTQNQNSKSGHDIIFAPWKSTEEIKEQLPEKEKEYVDSQKFEPVVQEKPFQKEKKIAEEKEIKQSSQVTPKNSDVIEIILPGDQPLGYTIKVERTDEFVRVYQYSENSTSYKEFTLFKDCGLVLCEGCFPPGLYYRTSSGPKRIVEKLYSRTGVPMYNIFYGLTYSSKVKEKIDLDRMQGKIDHDFPMEIDAEAEKFARIIIKNDVNNPAMIKQPKTILEIAATIPGEVKYFHVSQSTGKPILYKKLFGVFEFLIKKNLYQRDGECTHRCFNQINYKVGKDTFSQKVQEKNNTNDRQSNK